MKFQRPSITGCFVLLLLTAVPPAYGDELSVVVRESKLRSAPSHWSPVSGDLRYGDILSRLGTEGGWEKVVVGPSGSAANREGYVHSSAVSARRVILTAGTQVSNSQVDPANVVLAGKGFNADCEDLYRSNGKDLDYRAVDNWEKQTVSDSEVQEFLQQGGLKQ